MALQWVSCDLRTGQVVAELPDLNTQQIQHTLGQYDSATVSLPVAGTPAPPSNWLQATTPLESMLVAINDAGDPVWGGIVTQRTRVGGAQTQLAVTTPEGYTARRFVRDTLQYPQTDRLLIASDLLTRYVVDGASGRPGLPLRIAVIGTGALVDGNYADADDKTIYSILQDLGMEWSLTLEWQSNPTRLTHVAALAERIGTPAPAGLGPAVTLDWPGNLSSAQIVEDYSDGKGANDVMATSTGQGEVRPQSDHQVTTQARRPTVETRVDAGSNITSRDTLNTYAAAVLAAQRDGSVAYSLAIPQNDPAAWAFGLGDDVGLDITGPEFPESPSTVVRVAGRQIDASTVTPILVGSDADG